MTHLIRPGPEFRDLFRAFEHTAFRLEARDRYDAPYENESLRKFLSGEPDALPWMQTWLALLRELTAEGRRVARVRVVSMPLTDYKPFRGVVRAVHQQRRRGYPLPAPRSSGGGRGALP